MEVLEGIYTAVNYRITEEKHGGATIKHKTYWHLCFLPNNQIGLFGASKEWYKPFFKRDIIDLKGKIEVQKDTYLKGFIYNPYNQKKLIIEGEVIEKKLKLKAYYENTPEDIWLDDEFEYLDLDYESLEKEYNAT